jgi:CRP-like cAMP-binding protein
MPALVLVAGAFWRHHGTEVVMRKSSHDPKLDMLAAVPLLAGLNRDHLERVGQLCTRADVPADTRVCREGGPGLEFFLVIDGQAVVSIGGDPVAKVGQGGFFGELALLGGGPRTATVTAETSMSLFVLSGAEFAELMRTEPQVAVKMLPAIGARIRTQSVGGSQPLGS